MPYKDFRSLDINTKLKAARDNLVPPNLVEALIEQGEPQLSPPQNIYWTKFLESWLVLIVLNGLNWLGLFLSQFSSYWDDKTMGMWKAAFKGKVPTWIYFGCIFSLLPAFMAEVSNRFRARESDKRMDSIEAEMRALKQDLKDNARENSHTILQELRAFKTDTEAKIDALTSPDA